MELKQFRFVIFTFLVAYGAIHGVAGHGSILDPPQRSVMYRYGYRVAANYDFNALNCGGFSVIFQKWFFRWFAELFYIFFRHNIIQLIKDDVENVAMNGVYHDRDVTTKEVFTARER